MSYYDNYTKQDCPPNISDSLAQCLTKELPSRVLQLCISNVMQDITVDHIYAVCNRDACTVLRIVISAVMKSAGVVTALVEFKSIEEAARIQVFAHGRNMFEDSCLIDADFARVNSLDVQMNTDRTWDFRFVKPSPQPDLIQDSLRNMNSHSTQMRDYEHFSEDEKGSRSHSRDYEHSEERGSRSHSRGHSRSGSRSEDRKSHDSEYHRRSSHSYSRERSMTRSEGSRKSHHDDDTTGNCRKRNYEQSTCKSGDDRSDYERLHHRSGSREEFNMSRHRSSIRNDTRRGNSNRFTRKGTFVFERLDSPPRHSREEHTIQNEDSSRHRDSSKHRDSWRHRESSNSKHAEIDHWTRNVLNYAESLTVPPVQQEVNVPITLQLSNINISNINTNNIFNLFSQYGNVDYIKICGDQSTPTPNDVVLITMQTTRGGTTALEMLGTTFTFRNSTVILETVTIDTSDSGFREYIGDERNRNPSVNQKFSPPSCVLKFEGGPPSLTTEQLASILTEKGAPVPMATTFSFNKRDENYVRKSRGWIKYESIDDAIDTITLSNHYRIKGTSLKLSFTQRSFPTRGSQRHEKLKSKKIFTSEGRKISSVSLGLAPTKCVLIVTNILNTFMSCDYLYNIVSQYDDVLRIKFSANGTQALVEITNPVTIPLITSCLGGLHTILGLEQQMLVMVSGITTQLYAHKQPYEFCTLPSGNPSFKDFTVDGRTWLDNPKIVSRLEFALPTSCLLRFRHLAPLVTAEELRSKFNKQVSLSDFEIQFERRQPFTLYPSGFFKFNSIENATKALVMCNNMKFKCITGRIPIKLSFTAMKEFPFLGTSEETDNKSEMVIAHMEKKRERFRQLRLAKRNFKYLQLGIDLTKEKVIGTWRPTYLPDRPAEQIIQTTNEQIEEQQPVRRKNTYSCAVDDNKQKAKKRAKKLKRKFGNSDLLTASENVQRKSETLNLCY